MKDFEEIARSNLKFELTKDEIKLAGKKQGDEHIVFFFVCISYDGVILGRGFPNQVYPKPSILAPLVSDREGMFGMICPSCSCYFRSEIPRQSCFSCQNSNPIATCPYCEFTSQHLAFLTPNQIEFLDKFIEEITAFTNSELDKTIIDLNQLKANLRNNKSKWIYVEERQQRLFRCGKCQNSYDILGDYGCCPSCQTYNHSEVISKKIEHVKISFNRTKQNVSDRHEREYEWKNKLVRCVSEFESLANDLRRRMTKIPFPPKRKNELKNISFQNILKANDKLNIILGFEFLEGINKTDRSFLNKVFNRRHIIEHNSGKVDEEYLRNTNDTLKLGEAIRVKSSQIKRIIDLIEKITQNLIQGVESMFVK